MVSRLRSFNSCTFFNASPGWLPEFGFYIIALCNDGYQIAAQVIMELTANAFSFIIQLLFKLKFPFFFAVFCFLIVAS